MYESDYLAVAFLAFHQTPQFVKLIQNVELSQKTSRLHFLNQNTLTGQPVAKDLLIRQLLLDASILESYKE